MHFAPEMWEKTRVDGTRKLKLCAVPTIFSFSPIVIERKAPTKRQESTTIKIEPKKKSQAFLHSLSEEEIQPQPSTPAESNHLCIPSK